MDKEFKNLDDDFPPLEESIRIKRKPAGKKSSSKPELSTKEREQCRTEKKSGKSSEGTSRVKSSRSEGSISKIQYRSVQPKFSSRKQEPQLKSYKESEETGESSPVESKILESQESKWKIPPKIVQSKLSQPEPEQLPVVQGPSKRDLDFPPLQSKISRKKSKETVQNVWLRNITPETSPEKQEQPTFGTELTKSDEDFPPLGTRISRKKSGESLTKIPSKTSEQESSLIKQEKPKKVKKPKKAIEGLPPSEKIGSKLKILKLFFEKDASTKVSPKKTKPEPPPEEIEESKMYEKPGKGDGELSIKETSSKIEIQETAIETSPTPTETKSSEQPKIIKKTGKGDEELQSPEKISSKTRSKETTQKVSQTKMKTKWIRMEPEQPKPPDKNEEGFKFKIPEPIKKVPSKKKSPPKGDVDFPSLESKKTMKKSKMKIKGPSMELKSSEKDQDQRKPVDSSDIQEEKEIISTELQSNLSDTQHTVPEQDITQTELQPLLDTEEIQKKRQSINESDSHHMDKETKTDSSDTNQVDEEHETNKSHLDAQYEDTRSERSKLLSEEARNIDKDSDDEEFEKQTLYTPLGSSTDSITVEIDNEQIQRYMKEFTTKLQLQQSYSPRKYGDYYSVASTSSYRAQSETITEESTDSVEEMPAAYELDLNSIFKIEEKDLSEDKELNFYSIDSKDSENGQESAEIKVELIQYLVTVKKPEDDEALKESDQSKQPQTIHTESVDTSNQDIGEISVMQPKTSYAEKLKMNLVTTVDKEPKCLLNKDINLEKFSSVLFEIQVVMNRILIRIEQMQRFIEEYKLKAISGSKQLSTDRIQYTIGDIIKSINTIHVLLNQLVDANIAGPIPQFICNFNEISMIEIFCEDVCNISKSLQTYTDHLIQITYDNTLSTIDKLLPHSEDVNNVIESMVALCKICSQNSYLSDAAIGGISVTLNGLEQQMAAFMTSKDSEVPEPSETSYKKYDITTIKNLKDDPYLTNIQHASSTSTRADMWHGLLREDHTFFYNKYNYQFKQYTKIDIKNVNVVTAVNNYQDFQTPFRAKFALRVLELYNYPRYYTPKHIENIFYNYFCYRNAGFYKLTSTSGLLVLATPADANAILQCVWPQILVRDMTQASRLAKNKCWVLGFNWDRNRKLVKY